MKIAFVNMSYGKTNRGAETFVRELSKRLKLRHQVEILSDNKAAGKRWPILWRIFLDPHGLSILLFTLKMLPKIFKEKYDFIVPVDGGWEPALVRITTWLYGGKMVISGQSGKGWDDRINLWTFPDYFVPISTFLTGWAKRWNPFIKISYIPNGVDLKKFTFKGPSFKVPLEKPIILCVGALTNEKRIERVIDAVSKLNSASLMVVGDGPLKEKIELMGKRKLGKHFFLGRADFKDMPSIYRSADLFTIPSPWYRSFEIVLVEAMATNLPVVANDDPIRREIVGDAGLFVDPTDTGKYAGKLEEALATGWGNKPRKQAEKFSWDDIAKKYEILFKELTG